MAIPMAVQPGREPASQEPKLKSGQEVLLRQPIGQHHAKEPVLCCAVACSIWVDCPPEHLDQTGRLDSSSLGPEASIVSIVLLQ